MNTPEDWTKYADEVPARGLTIDDVDLWLFKDYFKKNYGEELEKQPNDLQTILNNMNLANGEELNLAGALLFSRNTQYKLPLFMVKAVTNALIHRDYFVSAPIRVFVFSNRVEIISPGHLPNKLTVENIKAGNSNIRNPILASFASKILPYRGLGTGIRRALEANPVIEFMDDREANFFHVVIHK